LGESSRARLLVEQTAIQKLGNFPERAPLQAGELFIDPPVKSKEGVERGHNPSRRFVVAEQNVQAIRRLACHLTLPPQGSSPSAIQ
jgi:hypothetical protein